MRCSAGGGHLRVKQSRTRLPRFSSGNLIGVRCLTRRQIGFGGCCAVVCRRTCSAASTTSRMHAAKSRRHARPATPGAARPAAAPVLRFRSAPSALRDGYRHLLVVCHPIRQVRVSVLIADIRNDTGDPVFDRALEPIVKSALETSTFVVALGRTHMGVPPGEALDEVGARALAVKEGLGVVLSRFDRPSRILATTSRSRQPIRSPTA